MRKFKSSGIISLLDTYLQYNLAESTSGDIILGDYLDDCLLKKLSEIRLGYGTSLGNNQLRAEIAKRLDISQEKVLITNGSTAGLFMSIFCLCGEKDSVVTVSPNFPPILEMAPALNAAQNVLPLKFEENYQIDLDRLSKIFSQRTKLVILASPHNPSGTTINISTIKHVLEILAEKSPKAYLLIDEVYREATYGNAPIHKSVASLSEKILTVSSISKSHGAPGLRVGWITCHDYNLLEQCTLSKLNTVISCSVVDELIGEHILKNSDKILKSKQVLLAKGLELVSTWIEKNIEYVEWVQPKAGALCCVRLRPSVFDDEAVACFYDKAATHQVQIAPGNWFMDEKRVFRLGFGFLPLKTLPAALNALEKTYKSVL